MEETTVAEKRVSFGRAVMNNISENFTRILLALVPLVFVVIFYFGGLYSQVGRIPVIEQQVSEAAKERHADNAAIQRQISDLAKEQRAADEAVRSDLADLRAEVGRIAGALEQLNADRRRTGATEQTYHAGPRAISVVFGIPY